MQNTRNNQLLYIYHYTTKNAVEGILQSKQWYINSPRNMNDGLELIHLNEANIDNLFFSSYLTEDKESIAMWSMYSQPWEKGIIIKIPVGKMKEWINGNPLIYVADVNNREALNVIDQAQAQLALHFVAYTNADSKADYEQETLKCGNQENNNFNDIHNHDELAGYIKDIAWSYEKEIRLRVSVQSNETYNAVMLDIPPEILESFQFVTGPRFSGNLLAQIETIDPEFNDNRIIPSLFTGRLRWVYCDDCDR